tara:strand:+ start:307 stop:609 length:303 start_codon:yes stop_codon:yes gene_type:complete
MRNKFTIKLCGRIGQTVKNALKLTTITLRKRRKSLITTSEFEINISRVLVAVLLKKQQDMEVLLTAVTIGVGEGVHSTDLQPMGTQQVNVRNAIGGYQGT